MKAFPVRREPCPRTTPIIQSTEQRLMAAHNPRGQLFVITGHSGVGKTTAAAMIHDGINQLFDSDPGNSNAFRAKRFEVTNYSSSHGLIMHRRLLVEFGTKVLSLRSNIDIRNLNISDEMDRVIEGLISERIEIVFIDEAGRLPTAAFDCLVTLINKSAEEHMHRLTIVLIGMDELPVTVRQLPQVSRRVADTVMFTPCDSSVLLAVLGDLDDFFNQLDPGSENGREIVMFLMDETVSKGGLFGSAIPLVERAIAFTKEMGLPMGMKVLRFARTMKQQGEEKSIAASGLKWGGRRQ